MKLLIALLLILSASGQTIKPAHPRIFLDDARLAELRAKLVGTPAQQAQWNSMVSYIGTYCLTGTYSNVGCGIALSLAYQVDRSLTSYGDRACEFMYYHTNSSDGDDAAATWDSDGNLTSSDWTDWYGTAIYLIYDWAHDRCTTQQKSMAQTQFARFWALRDAASPISGNSKLFMYTDAKNTGNHTIGQVRAVFTGAIATHEPGVFDTTSTMTAALALWRSKIGPCFNNTTTNPDLESCSGGGWTEGTGYVPLAKTYAYDVMETVTTGTTDLNLWSEAPLELDTWMKYQFANTSPTGPVDAFGRNTYEPWQMGDIQQFWTFYLTDRDIMMRLASTFRRNGDTQRAAWTQYWLNVVLPFGRPGANSIISGNFPWEFLFHDPEASQSDYRAVAPDLATPFLVLGRSDTSATATWAGMTTQPSAPTHAHGDPGTIQVYRKGKWLVGDLPGYGTQAPLIYVLSTPSHSGRSLNWRGTKGSAWRSGTTVSDWSRMARTPSGGYKSVCGSLYCYAQGDIGGEYRFLGYNHTPDTETATRDFLYLKPDLIVVADRVKYVAGVNAATISHFQTHETAAAISGNRATITNGDQRLHVNVVYPPTPQITPVKNNLCMVMGAAKLSADAVNFSVDCFQSTAPGTVTISGITGEWSVLNGTWAYTRPSTVTQVTPYKDGISYNAERFRITSTGAFASITGLWPIVQSGIAATSWVKDVQIKNVSVDRWRIDVQSGQYANTDAQLVVMEAADDTATPIAVANASTTDWQLAQFGSYVAGSPKAAAPVLPVTYSFDPGAATTISHYLMGLTPATSYGVAVSSGTVTVTAGGSTVTTTPEGVLTFTSTGGTVALSVTTASLPDGIVGTAYSATLTASGGTSPRTFSILSGTLPAGLTLSGGTISGTPTAAGTASITVRVTDGVSATADKALSITVAAAGVALEIATASLPGGTVGVAYSTALSATGGETPYSWSVQSGTLCAGLSLSTAGVISGTPAQAETCTVTYRVTDSALSTVDRALSITTSGTPAISVAVYRRGTSAIVTLRGVPSYQTSCTVTAGTSSATSASGPSVRRVALTGLTPATAYTFLADCGAGGSGATDGPATAAVSGTRTFAPEIDCDADMTVQTGIPLGAAVTMPHSAGRCSTSLSLAAGVATAIRFCRGSICGAPIYFIP